MLNIRGSTALEEALNYYSATKRVSKSARPVVTEVAHMLDVSVKIQLDFLKWINAEGSPCSTSIRPIEKG